MTYPIAPASSFVNVAVHRSFNTDQWQQELLSSFRTRRINHRFLYESPKQAARWLALHEACSPSRFDPACQEIYQEAFNFVGQCRMNFDAVISLGSGGGQKDAVLIDSLHRAGVGINYYQPVDVSIALLLESTKAVQNKVKLESKPLLMALSSRETPQAAAPVNSNLLLAFGLLPNFEPNDIFKSLKTWVRKGDLLLVSANLAPGEDYAAGVQRVFPGYDNGYTREWLTGFLVDAGFEREDGEWRFQIRNVNDLLRIEAVWEIRQERQFTLFGELFQFNPGDSIQVFYSYRYTLRRFTDWAERYGFALEGSWITPSGEEGVFLLRS
ncbi:MAG: L-histidine N(alpha)-methyltransferase [Verrucomicrobiota bacterium]|nr:L-histidine N(alpha)-methyltransferase [Verrucomicrobiota bacterium]